MMLRRSRGASIGAAYFVTAITPGTVTANELTSERLARTEPSLLDLGVAIAAGLAAPIQERVDERDVPDVALFAQPGLIRTLASNGELVSIESAAGDPMFFDDPACLLYRQAYRSELRDDTTIGPDGDVDVFVMPGPDAGDPAPLLLAGEFAGAFTSKPGAAELMLHLAKPSSGEIWARSGGYLSPHVGFDVGAYPDDFDRRLAAMIESAEVLRFDGSDTMPPRVGVGTFWTGIVEFVRTRDLDRTIATIDAGYDRDDS